MTAMQAEIGSTYNTPDHSGPRIGPEAPMMARSLERNRAKHQTPSAGLRFRAFRSDPNAPMKPSVVWTMRQKRMLQGAKSDPNAPSSSEAGDDYRLFHVPEPHWLAEALAALAEVDDEIAEEDLPPVGEATKTEAERIIKALARRAPAPTVYPTQDAEIALHFKAPGRTGTVVILLSDGGRADCHAYVGGTSRRAHYGTSSDLPDAFVLDQLRRLTPPSRAAVSTPDAGFLQFGTTFLPMSLHPMW